MADIGPGGNIIQQRGVIENFFVVFLVFQRKAGGKS